MWRLIGTAVGISVLAQVAGVSAVRAQESQLGPETTSALVGDWVLNPTLSDDPAERMPRQVVPPGGDRQPESRPSGTAQLRQAIERFSLSQKSSPCFWRRARIPPVVRSKCLANSETDMPSTKSCSSSRSSTSDQEE